MSLEILGVEGIGEVRPGDDLAALIVAAVGPEGLRNRDCVVVTQKVVSKAENRLAAVDPGDPLSHKPLVEAESVRVLRRRGDLVISETAHGFVCANAGVDLSNVEEGFAALLPVDSDRSARRVRDRIRALSGVEVAVVISDTFGRPWRRGVTDTAIGCAGIAAVVDLRGSTDALGRELKVTEVAVADEIAGGRRPGHGQVQGGARRGGSRPGRFLVPQRLCRKRDSPLSRRRPIPLADDACAEQRRCIGGHGLPASLAARDAMTSGRTTDDIRLRYQRFAKYEAKGVSATYESFAAAVANDDASLRQLAQLPREKQQPNLLFAAVRHAFGLPSSVHKLLDVPPSGVTAILLAFQLPDYWRILEGVGRRSNDGRRRHRS